MSALENNNFLSNEKINKKYLKYKNKYLLKKELFGGANGIKTLYISISVPGSGKTSRFEKSANFHKGIRVEADDYPGLYQPVFDFRKLGEAHKWCQEKVLTAMKEGVEDIYQSNTNLDPKNMLSYLEMAKIFGYQVRIIIPNDDKFGLPNLLYYPNTLSYEQQKEHLKFVRSGDVDGQKKIPNTSMDRMIIQYEQIIGKIKKIKTELYEMDMDYDPKSWIDKINQYF